MTPADRILVADVLALVGQSKASVANAAEVKPSALSHWLNGKPSISSDKLDRILAALGLKRYDEKIYFRDNDELLAPRVWRAEESVHDASIRVLNAATEQYGELQFGLPADIRGVAIIFSSDGRFGVIQRCNPLMLIGHSETAGRVGQGVIQRILDGDTKALIDASKVLSLTGRVDYSSLEVSNSIRDTIQNQQRQGSHEDIVSNIERADTMLQWAEVAAEALKLGLTPAVAKAAIQRFARLNEREKGIFLKNGSRGNGHQ